MIREEEKIRKRWVHSLVSFHFPPPHNTSYSLSLFPPLPPPLPVLPPYSILSSLPSIFPTFVTTPSLTSPQVLSVERCSGGAALQWQNRWRHTTARNGPLARNSLLSFIQSCQLSILCFRTFTSQRPSVCMSKPHLLLCILGDKLHTKLDCPVFTVFQHFDLWPLQHDFYLSSTQTTSPCHEARCISFPLSYSQHLFVLYCVQQQCVHHSFLAWLP